MRFLVFCFLALISCFVQAQDVKTIVKKIQLKSDSRQMASKKALNELSRELVIEAIGKTKYKEEKSRIEKYIIKNQNRYILSTRFSSPVLQDDGNFAFTVTFTVSKKNLKNILLEHNLFYSSKGSFCLLPVVSFFSYFTSEKKTYSWWLQNQNESTKYLQPMARSFFSLLNKELISNGFYVLDPEFQKMREGTPPAVLPTKSRKFSNFVPLAEFYSCDIILIGHVYIGKLIADTLFDFKNVSSSFDKKKEESDHSQNWILFSFNVFNIKSRQFLFKLKKKTLVGPEAQKNPQQAMHPIVQDVLDSLTYQLSSYQNDGSLDLNRLMISVQGPLTYADKERLKVTLIKNIPGIQSLEERLLTSSRVVYLAQASHSIRDISRQIKAKRASLPGFIVQVKGVNKKELEIYAKKRGK